MTRPTFRLAVVGPLAVTASCVGPCARTPEPKMTVETLHALPGADPHPDDLARRLAARLEALGPDYTPRTHHLQPDGAPTYVNRLVLETSPYLLQHAHNPVNWFPWGEEAFALAAALDRPVLLSVGYSTCHWCHVMERESFEDEEIAAYINAHYVAIKVDREERPDVDGVYMNAVQLMTGRGGWPMTVALTPDRRPFFGGTYFPARDGDRGARTGFLTILEKLSEAYATRRDEVTASAQKLSSALARMNARPAQEGLPDASALTRAAAELAERYDRVHGGFGRAPKFPRPSTYGLLLRYARRAEDPGARRMVTRSLRAMGDGGIYDHVGGGFARYSTDAKWLVPHFEKMLYDNAQLVEVLTEAWQASREPYYRAKAEDTLQYVLREMTDPEGGGFYSATDADSEGEEGKFFVWTPGELEAALGAEDARIAMAYWGVTPGGNFEGKSILHRSRGAAAVAADLGLTSEALEARIEPIRRRLYETRLERVPPLLDDKILTEWNGQMISAFARAGFAFDRPEYLAAAARAARFVRAELLAQGRLRRAYRAGEARHDAVLEDYAFFVAGLLDLFEATADRAWLALARDLQAQLDARYWDAEAGGYFTTADDAEALLVREKPSYDGAQPSGNSVAALNLLRLAELFDAEAHRERARRILQWQKAELEDGAGACPKLAAALDAYLFEAQQIVLVTTPDDDAARLQDELRQAFLPNATVVIGTEDHLGALTDLVPWLEGKIARGGRATAYVCRGYVCDAPTSDPDTLRAQLGRYDRLEAPPLEVPAPAPRRAPK